MNNIAFALTIVDGYPLGILIPFRKKGMQFLHYVMPKVVSMLPKLGSPWLCLAHAFILLMHVTLGISFSRVAMLPFIVNLHHHFFMFYHFHVLFHLPQKGMPLLHWQLVCKDYKGFNLKKAFHLDLKEIVQDSKYAQIGPPSHWIFPHVPRNWT